MFKLVAPFKVSPDQEKAVDELEKIYQADSHGKSTLLGVTGSGKTFVMANLIARLNKPTLILSHNKTLAGQLFQEFCEFFPDNAVKYFVSYYDYYQPEAYIPSRDLYIEKESQINKQIELYRSSAMQALLSRRDTIVVASVSAIYNIGNPDSYENHIIELKVGSKYVFQQLFRDLAFIQYQRSDIEFSPGYFKVKGDTVYIYPTYDEIAIKLSFFGDDLESIDIVDPLTNRSISRKSEYVLFPAKNFIFEKDKILKATNKIKEDLDARLFELERLGKNLEAYRLKQRTLFDIELLEQTGMCKSMENYSIYLEDRKEGEPPYTLIDYFRRNFLTIIDESHITISQIGGMYNGDKARKTNLVDYGFRLPSALDNRPLKFDEFYNKLEQVMFVSATPTEWEIKESTDVVQLLTRPTGLLDPEIIIEPTEYQIDRTIKYTKEAIERGERAIITTLTKKMAEDLTDYMKNLEIKCAYIHSEIDTMDRTKILQDLRLGKYDVLIGINLLREGIDLPEVSTILILDADKEGFLRSKTSLIQIIGRGARHLNGKAILFADKITQAIKDTVSETHRRREYQQQYNERFGITPTAITKKISDQLTKEDDYKQKDVEIDYIQDDKALETYIENLEGKMFIYSQNLQFEKAIEVRNLIDKLKKSKS